MHRKICSRSENQVDANEGGLLCAGQCSLWSTLRTQVRGRASSAKVRSESATSLEPDRINYSTGASRICCGRSLDKVSELAVPWLSDQTNGDLVTSRRELSRSEIAGRAFEIDAGQGLSHIAVPTGGADAALGQKQTGVTSASFPLIPSKRTFISAVDVSLVPLADSSRGRGGAATRRPTWPSWPAAGAGLPLYGNLLHNSCRGHLHRRRRRGHSRARIRDMDGSSLGEGESGPANIIEIPTRTQSIRLACEGALWSAGLDEQSLQHRTRDQAWQVLASRAPATAAFRKTAVASMVLETDAYVAWLGAHQGGDGAIVIGPRILWSSLDQRPVHRRRGTGLEASDEAGGQGMGREALRRTLRAFDGRAEKTALSRRSRAVHLGSG